MDVERNMAAVALSESRDIGQSPIASAPLLYSSPDRAREIQNGQRPLSSVSPPTSVKKEGIRMAPVVDGGVTVPVGPNAVRMQPQNAALTASQTTSRDSLADKSRRPRGQPLQQADAVRTPRVPQPNRMLIDPLAAVYQQHCDLISSLREEDREDDGGTVDKLGKLSNSQLLERVKDVFNWSHNLSVDEARELQRGRNLGIPCLMNVRIGDDYHHMGEHDGRF